MEAFYAMESSFNKLDSLRLMLRIGLVFYAQNGTCNIQVSYAVTLTLIRSTTCLYWVLPKINWNTGIHYKTFCWFSYIDRVFFFSFGSHICRFIHAAFQWVFTEMEYAEIYINPIFCKNSNLLDVIGWPCCGFDLGLIHHQFELCFLTFNHLINAKVKKSKFLSSWVLDDVFLAEILLSFDLGFLTSGVPIHFVLLGLIDLSGLISFTAWPAFVVHNEFYRYFPGFHAHTKSGNEQIDWFHFLRLDLGLDSSAFTGLTLNRSHKRSVDSSKWCTGFHSALVEAERWITGSDWPTTGFQTLAVFIWRLMLLFQFHFFFGPLHFLFRYLSATGNTIRSHEKWCHRQIDYFTEIKPKHQVQWHLYLLFHSFSHTT